MKRKLYYGCLIVFWVVVSGWLIAAKATAEEQRVLRQHMEQDVWSLKKLSHRIENMPTSGVKDALLSQVAGRLLSINHESEELTRRSPSCFWILTAQIVVQSLPFIVLVPIMLKRGRLQEGPNQTVEGTR